MPVTLWIRLRLCAHAVHLRQLSWDGDNLPIVAHEDGVEVTAMTAESSKELARHDDNYKVVRRS